MKQRMILKQKLQSETGASLMVALLFFVLCAVVGSVILAAAATAVGSVPKVDSDANRQRYALESAVEMIKDSLEADSSELLLRQSWAFRELEIDEENPNDNSYTAGERVHGKGYYVMKKDAAADTDMRAETKFDHLSAGTAVSVQLANSDEYGNVDQFWRNSEEYQKYRNNESGFKTELRELRDLMVESIYRHYWPEIAHLPNNESENAANAQDPWNGVPPSTALDLSLLVGNKPIYRVGTEKNAPIQIECPGMPMVYADVQMDSSLGLYFTLFCTKNEAAYDSSKDNRDQVLYLSFRPKNSRILYRSETEERDPIELKPIEIMGTETVYDDNGNATGTRTVVVETIERNLRVFYTKRNIDFCTGWERGEVSIYP